MQFPFRASHYMNISLLFFVHVYAIWLMMEVIVITIQNYTEICVRAREKWID